LTSNKEIEKESSAPVSFSKLFSLKLEDDLEIMAIELGTSVFILF